MKHIPVRDWIAGFLLALAGGFLWWQFSYSRLLFPEVSVDRRQAQTISREFIARQGADPAGFRTAAVLLVDEPANRYLQKTLGFSGLENFIREYDYPIFFWLVRFFQPESKEEFLVTVAPATGEIIGYRHLVEDTAARPSIGRDDAVALAWKNLNDRFGHDPGNFRIQGDLETAREFRSDYSFSWMDESVIIPWKDDPQAGVGRLMTSATIGGDRIQSFSKKHFKVPEDFSRHLTRQKSTGRNISALMKIIYYVLLIAATFVLLTGQGHLVLGKTKKLYIILAGCSVLFSVINELNIMEIINFNYSTSHPLASYYWQTAVDTLFVLILASLTILIPGLSGERLNFQNSPEKEERALFGITRSGFFCRPVGERVFMGYLGFAALLGLQAGIFKFGQHYWEVWTERQWLTEFSSAYIPFIAALVMGWKAGVYEEVMFRLFTISWLKSILQKFVRYPAALNSVIAVAVSALIWGFAHSNYPVFPMWFRGVEVSLLGFFIGWLYLRFGLVTVLVAHYAFDVFWGSVDFLFSGSFNFYKISALAVLLFPAFFAIFALFRKARAEGEDGPLVNWDLNANQKFNLDVLAAYLERHSEEWRDQDENTVKQKIVKHGWDPVVVDLAFGRLRHKNNPTG
jgi:hypothetical protein